MTARQGTEGAAISAFFEKTTAPQISAEPCGTSCKTVNYLYICYITNIIQLHFAFAYFEFDVLSLFEAAKTLFVDSGVVNEDVTAGFSGDKAITFGSIEPFDCTFHLKMFKIKK